MDFSFAMSTAGQGGNQTFYVYLLFKDWLQWLLANIFLNSNRKAQQPTPSKFQLEFSIPVPV